MTIGGWQTNTVGLYRLRGVQYVHCLMHKCIMVKLGGNEKHIKYVKKYASFTKSEGKFGKVGGK